jgi:hypothetical protein
MAGRVSNELIFLLNNTWLLLLLWNSAETSGLIPFDPSAETGTVQGAIEAIMHSQRANQWHAKSGNTYRNNLRPAVSIWADDEL